MAASSVEPTFRAALLVVDLQEDFCPPNGSLAISGAREIVPAINNLLSLPFALKIATQDYHPLDHVSFETSHPPPENKPFISYTQIANPIDSSDILEIPIWPVHCVQGTKGADLVSELNISKFDKIMKKGMDKRVEMFSGFADCFGNKTEAASFDLTEELQKAAISHIYMVGVAGDYCVRSSAIDAKKVGFTVLVVEEAIRSVDAGEQGWGSTRTEFQRLGIETISINSAAVARVKQLG